LLNLELMKAGYPAAVIRKEDRAAYYIEWLVGNPLAGDVMPGAGGLRKVRRGRAGMGKRGGTNESWSGSAGNKGGGFSDCRSQG
jgi:hypothetical protein